MGSTKKHKYSSKASSLAYASLNILLALAVFRTGAPVALGPLAAQEALAARGAPGGPGTGRSGRAWAAVAPARAERTG